MFLEVRDNFSEGLRFYMSLQEAVSHLAQQVGDYSMTRQIQRSAALMHCPSLSVCPSVCLSVCLSVRLSVHPRKEKTTLLSVVKEKLMLNLKFPLA